MLTLERAAAASLQRIETMKLPVLDHHVTTPAGQTLECVLPTSRSHVEAGRW